MSYASGQSRGRERPSDSRSVGSRMTTATTTVMHGEEMHDKMRSNVKRTLVERLAGEEEIMAAAGALGKGSAPRSGSRSKKQQPSKPKGFRDAARQRIHDDNTDSASVVDARRRMARSRAAERDVAGLDLDESVAAGLAAGPRRRHGGGSSSPVDGEDSKSTPQRYGGKLNLPETPAQRSARLMQSLSSIEATLASVKRDFRQAPTTSMPSAAGAAVSSPRSTASSDAARRIGHLPLHQFASATTREEATARDEATTATTSAARMHELTVAAKTSRGLSVAHLTGIELASEQIRALRAELLLAIQRHREAEQAANDTRSSLLQERQELQTQVSLTVATSRDAKARFDEAVVTLRAANRDLASAAENERAKRVAMTEQLADVQRNAAAMQNRLAGRQASAEAAREAAELVAAIAGIAPPMETGRVTNQLQSLRVQVSELSAALDLTRRQRDGYSDNLQVASAALNAHPDAGLLRSSVIPAIRSQVMQLQAPVDTPALTEAAADEQYVQSMAGGQLMPSSQQPPGDDAAQLGQWLHNLEAAATARDVRVARAVLRQAESGHAAQAAAAAAAADSTAQAQQVVIDKLQAQLGTTQGALAAARDQLRTLASEREALSRQTAAAEALSRSNATKVKFLEKQLQDSRGNPSDSASTDKLRSAQRQSQEAAAALSSAQAENKQLSAQLAALKMQLSVSSSTSPADASPVSGADEAADLREQLKQAHTKAEQVAKRQAQASQAAAAITASFKSQLMRARDEIERLQAATPADASPASGADEAADLREQLKQAHTKAEQVAKRQAQASQAAAAITASFKSQLMRARDEIERLQAAAQDTATPHSTPKPDGSASHESLSEVALKQQVRELRKRLAESSAAAALARDRLASVGQHVSAAAAAAPGHTATVPKTASTAVASEVVSPAPTKAVAGDLRAQLQAVQGKLDDSVAEADDLRAQLQAVQGKLGDSVAEADDLRAQLSAASESAAALKQRVLALQQSADAASTAALQLRGERDAAISTQAHLREQLQASEEECARLRRRLGEQQEAAAAAAEAASSSNTMRKKLRVARSSMAVAQASLTASQGTIVALVEKVMALQAAARGALPPPEGAAPAVGGGLPADVIAGHFDSVLQRASVSAPREALLAVRGLAAASDQAEVRAMQVVPTSRVDKAGAANMATAVHSVASYNGPLSE